MGIVIRISFLTATIFMVTYLVLDTQYYVSQFILSIIIVIQVIMLAKYLERTNVLLTRFLEAIKYSDFTGAFRNHEMGAGFGDLNKAFSRVIDKFKDERSKKEESIRYLETVVQHIGIGLMCFNAKGEVVLLNTAAKRLFQVATIRNIDSLKSISEKLFEVVKKMKGGSRSLARVSVNKETLQLAIYATDFKMRSKAYKLVSFQNIHTELEEKEMEAWQNLTQVLAHEIMNSITPIASLSATVHMLLDQNATTKDENYEINGETIQDVKDALNTISKRSQGLMRFVNSYRDFTQIPEPDYTIFEVRELLERVANLMRSEASHQHIKLEVTVDPQSLELTADIHLVEQALINLVKNAIRAMEGQQDGVIKLKGSIDEVGKVNISIIDSGPGVKKSVSEKIFIPFYTMGSKKEGKGSGIGLSLSRQIMRLHGGTLTLDSELGEGSEFKLRF